MDLTTHLRPAGVVRIVSLYELEDGDRPLRQQVGFLRLLLRHTLELFPGQLHA